MMCRRLSGFKCTLSGKKQRNRRKVLRIELLETLYAETHTSARADNKREQNGENTKAVRVCPETTSRSYVKTEGYRERCA